MIRARAARARSWSRRRSTGSADAGSSSSSPSTAAPCRLNLIESESVRARARQLHRAPTSSGEASSSAPPAVRCSSTRSPRCRTSCRRSSYACSRPDTSCASAASKELPIDVRVDRGDQPRPRRRPSKDGKAPRGPPLPAERVPRSACRRCGSVRATWTSSLEHFLRSSQPRGADERALRAGDARDHAFATAGRATSASFKQRRPQRVHPGGRRDRDIGASRRRPRGPRAPRRRRNPATCSTSRSALSIA